MGQWTGVKPTPEQHRTAELARIADALERIANRPRFVALEGGHVFGIDHIRAVLVDPGGRGELYLSEDDEPDFLLSVEDMAHLLDVLEPTDGGR